MKHQNFIRERLHSEPQQTDQTEKKKIHIVRCLCAVTGSIVQESVLVKVERVFPHQHPGYTDFYPLLSCAIRFESTKVKYKRLMWRGNVSEFIFNTPKWTAGTIELPGTVTSWKTVSSCCTSGRRSQVPPIKFQLISRSFRLYILSTRSDQIKSNHPP